MGLIQYQDRRQCASVTQFASVIQFAWPAVCAGYSLRDPGLQQKDPARQQFQHFRADLDGAQHDRKHGIARRHA